MKRLVVATKALIVDGGRFIMMKRHDNDEFKPGESDLPGGNIEFGEDPVIGLKREIKEEISLEVDVIAPSRVWTLMKGTDTHVVGITFLCRRIGGKETLSHEHSEFRWASLNNYKKEGISSWLVKDIESVIPLIEVKTKTFL